MTTLASTTIDGSLTITNALGLSQIIEKVTISSSGAAGTINFDVLNQGVLYYTGNATANWTINLRGNSSTTFDSILSNNQSITVAFINTNGTTARYSDKLQIDGSDVTINWQSGITPTAGNKDTTEVYTYTVIKTGVTQYTVLAAVQKYSEFTPSSAGQAEFTTPGTYNWTAPAGVTSVSVVAVGGGGGGNSNWAAAAGSGGGLGWKNNIQVVPGNTYTVVVGDGGMFGNGSNASSGGTSYFISTSIVAGYGGGNAQSGANTFGPNRNGYGGGWVGDGGGAGGQGDNWTGGGGAGGYTGTGGNSDQNGSGGGGGGGSPYSSTYGTGAGGGVGIYGQGSSGVRGRDRGQSGWGGAGGSGGENGTNGENPSQPSGVGSNAITGGRYGGGGGGPGTSYGGGRGGSGAVRIIWSGSSSITRAFPSTNTGNISSTTTGVVPLLTDYSKIIAAGATAFSYIAMPGGTRTLLNYLQSFGISGSSQNTGSGLWNSSFSGNISYAASPINNNNYFTQYNRVRVIDGDGSADGVDWAVFNFGVANGSGDFDGTADTNAFFGGESSYSGGRGNTGRTTGQVWGFDPNNGWILLYQLPLGTSSGSSYNHSNGNWFSGGGTTSTGNGKRVDFDSTPISYIGFVLL